nr:cytochrome P450 81E8 [Arachis hypogaea]
MILLLLLFLFLAKFILERNNKNNKNLPPSPTSLPIIGHLHLINQPLHRSLHNLTKKYGHILFLKLGTRNVLVVSSPSAIEECFTNNDIIFANRPQTLAGKHLNYNCKTMAFVPYGDHWRSLRRLTSLELFTANRLAMLARVREDEVQLLLKQLFQDCKAQNLKVELRPRFFELSFNIMLRMISGKRNYGKDIDEEGKEFQILVKEMAELLGSGNLNDFIPLLKWIDFQGVEKRMVRLMKKMDGFLQKLLDDHRRNKSIKGNQQNNMNNLNLIDVMLDLQHKDPEFYTHETVKGVILAMLTAGSETSATTLEWAVSLLLNNPKTMKKLEAEIETHAGHGQLLNESEATKLKYLQSVITETLRLYPAAPLLLPHESSNDCKVCGYDIPKGTMLLVNAWTLQRDPDLWVDPAMFVPERFDLGDGSGGGDHVVYNMVPFGVGRRVCPGAALAKRVMVHALGALVQCFELDKIGNEEINMKEGLGLTMPKVEPLVVLCSPRQQMIKILSDM